MAGPASRGRADRSLRGRLRDLLAKLMSVKALVLATATALVACRLIDGWVWLAAAGLVVTGRLLEKRTPWSDGG